LLLYWLLLAFAWVVPTEVQGTCLVQMVSSPKTIYCILTIWNDELVIAVICLYIVVLNSFFGSEQSKNAACVRVDHEYIFIACSMTEPKVGHLERSEFGAVIWCAFLAVFFLSFWFPKHYVFFSGEYSTWRLDKDLNIHFMVYLCMCIGVMSSFRRQCFIIFACFIVVLILYWTRNGRHISYTTSDEQVWVSCVPV